jgi:hypothetical protein
MSPIIEIKTFPRKNSSFILDLLLFIVIGIILSFITGTSLRIIGIGITLFTALQLVRRLAIIMVFDKSLIVKRPLIPFGIGDDSFSLDDIEEIKFHRTKGRFGGMFVTIKSLANSTRLSINSNNEEIDYYCKKLDEIGINNRNEIEKKKELMLISRASCGM